MIDDVYKNKSNKEKNEYVNTCSYESNQIFMYEYVNTCSSTLARALSLSLHVKMHKITDTDTDTHTRLYAYVYT